MAKPYREPKTPDAPAEIPIQARIGQGCWEWLEEKRAKYQRDRGRTVSLSEFIRAMLEEAMIDERRRQKAAL